MANKLPGQTVPPARGSAQLHFGLIFLVFALVSIYYYGNQVSVLAGAVGSPYDRILFLIPIIYAALAFDSRGGLYASVAALVVMLPRALLASTAPLESATESLIVAAAGAAGSLWIGLGTRQRRELEEARLTSGQAQARLRSQLAVNTEQQRQLASFVAFSAKLSQSLELSQVLQTGIRMVMEMMRVQVVLVFSLDRKAGELRVIAHEGIPDASIRGIDGIKVGEGFSGRVVETGEPMVVTDISTDPRLARPSVKEEKLQASLVIPLRARGEIIGTLSVGTRMPRVFEQSEIDLLVSMGNQIGIAMENSRLYQEQVNIVEQLRNSEERYRQLFENAHDAIWVQDLQGINVAANDAAGKLIGYEKGQDIVGKNVREFIPPESRSMARDIRHKLLHREPIEQPYEQRLIRKDGSIVQLKLTTSLITANGRPAAFQHIARDITTERLLQENLRFYVQQITRAQEEEAKRIARELHDSSAQSLIATLHQMENFCRDNPDTCERDSKFIWALREQLRTILQEIRQFSRDLRPSILDDLGLLPAVEWLTEELKREHKVESSLTVEGAERRFSPEMEVALFRITQEALRNIVKHAAATRVDVRIEFRDKETVVTITDNGKGFEPPAALGDLPRSGKLGLLGMQERARLIGGTLDIRSEPGKGTTLRVRLPVGTL